MAPKQKRVTKYIVTLLAVCCVWMITGFFTPTSTIDDSSIARNIVEPLPEVGMSILPITPIAMKYEVYAAHASEEVTVVEVEVVGTSSALTTEPPLDRTKPIYMVYKDGFAVDVPAEWQWYIRDMANEYGFDEKIIFGMILKESCFNPNSKGDNERSLGLAQINHYWIKTDTIPHFTEDYRDRNLLDPYDNILTLMELWCYARDTYGLDVNEELDMKRLLYWHNTGQDPRRVNNWPYSNKIFDYAAELVLIEY